MFKNIYSMLLSLIIGSLSARYLGPSNYGLLSYGSSIIAFFTTVSKLGFDSVVVAEMARTPKKEGSYLGSAFLMRFIASVLSFFSICVIVAVLEPENKLLQTVTILQAIAIIFQSTEVIYFWFQARLQMKYVTIAGIAALTATGLWRIILLVKQATIQWFAFSASLSALVSGICIILFFLAKSDTKVKVDKDDSRFLLSNSYHFIINGLAVTLYTQLDRIMLGKMVSEESVGFYSAASTIAVMWEFIPMALIHSAQPLLIPLYTRDKKEFLKKYQMLLVGISIMGVIVSLGFTVFAKLIVIILYGAEYIPSVPALSILVWSTSFSMIGSARAIWIVAEHKNKYSKYFTIAGAIINAVLNAIIIPIYGFVGASVTTLVSQMFVSLLSPLLFRETKEFTHIYFDSFKQLPEMLDILKSALKKTFGKKADSGKA